MIYISTDLPFNAAAMGRTLFGASYYADTFDHLVAQVEELREGDTEIDEAAYLSARAAIEAHNAAIPIPTPPAPPPDKNAILKQSVLAATTTDDLKAALAAWLNGS